MKKTRAIIAITVAGVLISLLLLVAAMNTPRITVEIVNYAKTKRGEEPGITIAVTNRSRLSIRRIDRIEIEQVSSTWCNRLRHADSATLESGSGERIEVLRPEARGRWRVVVFTCPGWREKLDNDFTRGLHLRFLYATYHATYSDWIDD